ncbi:MAG: chorismate synthase [Alphaproteobacteria bacterium]|nr:chorismate synthase [Alphaproteobacteria bacterium]
MNRFGHIFTFTSFGESHGPAIGGIVDGIPANISLSKEDIQPALDLRRPGINSLTTQRNEPDQIEIFSGIFEGKTTGTPLGFIIKNTNHLSTDYDDIKDKFRPAHADLTYELKYGIRDYRGGGRSSARETAVRVACGAIAKKTLNSLLPKSVSISSKVIQIGTETDPTKFKELIEKTKQRNDSIGCLVELQASNVPPCLGSPIYDKLDADIAKEMMGINAVKGVEIGEGFNVVNLYGSENADEMFSDDGENIRFKSNHAGGILGGISTGQDIIVRIAVKPTPSINQILSTVDKDKKNVSITTKGRHDPCIGLRICPVVEAMMWCILLDHYLMNKSFQ